MIVRHIALILGMLVWETPTQADTMADAQTGEQMAIIQRVNRPTLAYRAEVMNRMLIEANFFIARLKLPTTCPVEMRDVVYPHVSTPWFGIIQEEDAPYYPLTIFTNAIYDAHIPREQRLQALKFGVRGTIETTNFFFSFIGAKLSSVQRLSEHLVEYYSHDLDKLVGKTSLIDTNGAYQLATQWLASVDMDIPALRKLKYTVNQLHYRATGTTNVVTLPLFYVDFGTRHHHWPAGSTMKDYDEPLVSVEILGTTKELQEMKLNDGSLSKRPLMIITNGLDLVREPDPMGK